LIGLVLVLVALPARAEATGLLFAAEAAGDAVAELDLALYATIVFVILFSLLATFAWPQVRAGLDRREQVIAHDKLEADKARQEAGELRQKLQGELARVNEQMQQMMAKAHQDAKLTAAEELERGKAELAAEHERLRREMKISTDDALHKVWDQVTELALLVSSKAVRKQLTPEDHRGLIADALSQFRAAGQARLTEVREAQK